MLKLFYVTTKINEPNHWEDIFHVIVNVNSLAQHAI